MRLSIANTTNTKHIVLYLIVLIFSLYNDADSQFSDNQTNKSPFLPKRYANTTLTIEHKQLNTKMNG